MEIIDNRTSSKEIEPEKLDGYETFTDENFGKPIPTFNKILVQLDKIEQNQIKNGIFIPGTSIQLPNSGRVVAIGKYLITNGFKESLGIHINVGDRVLVSRIKKDVVEVNGTEYGLFNIVDIKLVYPRNDSWDTL